MKSIFVSLLFACIASLVVAQAPQALNYQAIARDVAGSPIVNAQVGVRFSVLHGSSSGNSVYTETHQATTNQIGLFNLAIGRGSSLDTFENIDWGASSYFLQVGIDPTGGTNYEVLGTASEFLSVPFALRSSSDCNCTKILDQTDGDTYIDTEPLPLGNDGDEIHMYLGETPGAGPSSPRKALVLRWNNTPIPNQNTMLEIFDPSGGFNTFIGEKSGQANVTAPASAQQGMNNTGTGYYSLTNNNAGRDNTAIGTQSLSSNTGGAFNTAIGSFSLYKNASGAGGYGRENTAVGHQALYENVNGIYNTATGVNALFKNVDGHYNTAIGRWSLNSNTSGEKNTVIGTEAMTRNTTGDLNTIIGYQANVGVGLNNLNNSTAIGASATVMTDNDMILGDNNVRVGIGISGWTNGPQNMLEINPEPTCPTPSGLRLTQLGTSLPVALPSPPTALSVDPNGDVILVDLTSLTGGSNDWHLNGNIIGSTSPYFLGTIDPNPIGNPKPLYFRVNDIHSGIIDPHGQVFLGFEAGLNNNNQSNTGIGYQALKSNLIGPGPDNTAIGTQALFSNTGGGNTAIGARALFDNSTGGNNTAIGLEALTDNIGGQANTAVGVWAMHENQTGQYNTVYGAFAMQHNLTGGSNTAIGVGTLDLNINGFNNTAIGVNALEKSPGHDNTATGVHALRNNKADGNTANGFKALEMNDTGWANTAVGQWSLNLNVDGFQNTATGVGALEMNITGHRNTATGASALKDKSADDNTAIGTGALEKNGIGFENTATGVFALNLNNDGYYNTAIGASALYNNTTGSSNTASGRYALLSNISGISNTATGVSSLQNNISGQQNTATGVGSLLNNTTGVDNTATGVFSLRDNFDGHENTATGVGALQNNIDGDENTANGKFALLANINGHANTANGRFALQANINGSNNTAVGFNSLITNTTGSCNSTLGSGADVSTNNLTNATAIGCGATVNASNKVRIGNGVVNVIEGQVAYSWPSDGRFKENIQDDVMGLDFIMKLKPVSYNFNRLKYSNHISDDVTQDMERTLTEQSQNRSVGFIAQDVEKTLRETGFNSFDAVHAPTNETDNYSLGYAEFVVPLVKAVQEQQAQIEELKQLNQNLQLQVDILHSELKEIGNSRNVAQLKK